MGMGLWLRHIVLAVILALFSLAAASAQDAGIPPTKVRFAHCFGPTSFLGKTAQSFADNVKQQSGGKITVDVFPAAQLFDCQSMPEAVSGGAIDAGLNMTTYLTQILPEIGVWSLPALFRSDDHAFAVTQGTAATITAELASKKGLQIVSYWPYGGLQWYANKSLQVPADMKGLKMRVISDVLARIVEGMGGAGVFVEANEVYAAMQRGTVDGYMNGYSSLIDRKLYEVTKFGIDVNQGYVMALLTFNKAFWDRLSDPVRRILSEAADRTRLQAQKDLSADERGKLQKAIDAGLKFYRPTAEQQEAWRVASKSGFDDYIKRTGKTGETLVNAIAGTGK